MTKEIVVKKRNGKLESLKIEKINRCVERACYGIEGVSASEVILDAQVQLYNKIPTSDIDKALTMSARAKIEKEPAYQYVAARLLLNTIYKEVFGEGVYSDAFEMQYRKSFITNLRALGKDGRLDPRLLEFDLKSLSAALDISADDNWKYLGIQTVYDRYLLHIGGRRMESPQAFWMRVAMGLAINEDNREERAIEFYRILSSNSGLSSTPTLFNAGTVHSQLSSCYLSTIEDSIDGIYGTIHNQARLAKFAGGLGVDWTPIRSTNAYIKGTNGQSQGVIPFLKCFNDQLVAVNQGGRRKGAGCAYMETWHGDIEDFLELRKNTGDDRRRCHDMNTANWIPDLFMKRVEENAAWYLFSPSDCPDLHDLFGAAFEARYQEYEAMAEAGKIAHNKVNAKDLWKKMLTAIFETGHPWLTFKDPSNMRYSNQHVGVVHSSNLCTEILLHTVPTKWVQGEVVETGETAVCFPAGTQILTDKGQMPIESCGGAQVLVPFESDADFHDRARYETATVIPQGMKKTYKIIGKGGFEISATGEHPVLVKRRPGDRRPTRKTPTLPHYEWVRTDALKVGEFIVAPFNDTVLAFQEARPNDEEWLAAGWMLGDGWQTKDSFGVVFGPQDGYAEERVVPVLNRWHDSVPMSHYASAEKNRRPQIFEQPNGVRMWATSKVAFESLVTERFGLSRRRAPEKRIPEQVKRAAPDQICSFLSALFSADGCVQGDLSKRVRPSVQLTSASEELLKEVLLLLKPLGIHGRVTFGETPNRPGRFQGMLRISHIASILRFHERIGFALAPEKQERLERVLALVASRHQKNVPFAGMNQSRILSIEVTGEEFVYDLSLVEGHHFIANGLVVHNCNLASMNLAKHIINGKLDEVAIAATIRTLIRGLDNVIDINFYPTREAKNANMRHRPVGMGVMGFHDALHMMGINYDSKEAVQFADETMEIISYYAILASSELAKERGTYSTYKGSLWDQGKFPIDTYVELMRYRNAEANLHSVLDWEPVRAHVAEHGMRNSNTMAIAPTATISYIAGCSQSIEPDFSMLYVYSTLSGDFTMTNTAFVEDMKRRKLWCPELIEALKVVDGDISTLSLPQEVKDQYKTAFAIPASRLIACAAARQKWIDQGQSLNLYADTTSLKTLNDMYMLAWKSGLKTTYYLRSKAASKIEKSTTSAPKTVDLPMQQAEDSAQNEIACSIEARDRGESCESCQ